MRELLIPALFYLFSAVAIISAFLVITQNNPVRCVLFLVVTFFASAILWLLLSAEFLALILILVYVGAVMTLFLFVVMMLDVDTESLRMHFIRYVPFGLILVALLIGLLLIALPSHWYEQSTEVQSSVQVLEVNDYTDGLAKPKSLSNTEEIGEQLYTQYVYAFELAAVILLVAMISAITLAHRVRGQTKRQSVLKQLMTRSQDRVELVSINSKK